MHKDVRKVPRHGVHFNPVRDLDRRIVAVSCSKERCGVAQRGERTSIWAARHCGECQCLSRSFRERCVQFGDLAGTGTDEPLGYDPCLYSSADPKFAFALRQFGDALAIQRARVDTQGTMTRPWLKADRVFVEGKRVALTITSSQEQTAIYVNGKASQGLVAIWACERRLDRSACTGELNDQRQLVRPDFRVGSLRF